MRIMYPLNPSEQQTKCVHFLIPWRDNPSLPMAHIDPRSVFKFPTRTNRRRKITICELDPTDTRQIYWYQFNCNWTVAFYRLRRVFYRSPSILGGAPFNHPLRRNVLVLYAGRTRGPGPAPSQQHNKRPSGQHGAVAQQRGGGCVVCLFG
jgi:hypothetical protein